MIESIFAKNVEESKGKQDTPLNPYELRLSEAGACQRMRVLRLMGEPETSKFPAHLRLQGQIVEDWVSRMLGGTAVRQFEITHQRGTGHADFLTPSGELWEAKKVSIGAMKRVPLESHLKQVQAMLHFWFGVQGEKPPAKLIYVPWENFFEYRIFPVEYSPELGKAIEQEMKELWTMFEQRDPPGVPEGFKDDDYPCYYESWSHEIKCQFWGSCWTERREKEIIQDSLIAAKLEEWSKKKEVKKSMAGDIEMVDDSIKEIQKMLDPHFDRWGGKLSTGIYEAKRVAMSRESFDLKTAELAGFNREQWKEYIKKSEFNQYYLKERR